MATRTYTVFLKNKEMKVTDEQLAEFAGLFGLSEELRSRISELFWLDLFIYSAEFGVDPNDVIREVHNLESGEKNIETKPATSFNRKPLQGLWHKHFFSHHFVPHNISNALKGGTIESLINEVMDPKKSPVVTKEMIGELAHRVTHEPIEERAKNNKLTGEWIIFAKHDQKNHYLCLNTHNAGDQQIYDRISKNCQREFPFLGGLL